MEDRMVRKLNSSLFAKISFRLVECGQIAAWSVLQSLRQVLSLKIDGWG